MYRKKYNLIILIAFKEVLLILSKSLKEHFLTFYKLEISLNASRLVNGKVLYCFIVSDLKHKFLKTN